MEIEIKALQVMLPYLNDVYVVGEKVKLVNQVDNTIGFKVIEEYGVIIEIKENKNLGYIQTQKEYLINFENGSILLQGVPTQILR